MTTSLPNILPTLAPCSSPALAQSAGNNDSWIAQNSIILELAADQEPALRFFYQPSGPGSDRAAADISCGCNGPMVNKGKVL